MSLTLNYTALSDRGLVRGNNEDSAYAGPQLLVLADGMGGHAAGEVASRLMVEHMEHLDRESLDNADMLELLGAAADEANTAIRDSVVEHPEQEGMGTTLSGLLFNGSTFGLIHVGDSRAYRLRDGELTQITEDDTFVQSLVNDGKLDPADVSSHPQKSLILKAYAGHPVEPHLELFDAHPGDRYLLCSDGLSDPVAPDTIATALAEGSPDVAAQRLIELALRSGGPDNITVVISDVVKNDNPPTEPVVVGALVPDSPKSHPDSAAGRAAALLSPAQPAEQDDESDDDEDHRRSVWPWIVGILVIALIVVFGLLFFLNQSKESYRLTVGDNDEFVIEQGRHLPVIGELDHEAYQVACINPRNELQITSVDGVPADCNVFTVDDLPQSQKNVVNALDSGDYDEVLGQLDRLAKEALPVCVDDGADNDTESQPSTECREVK